VKKPPVKLLLELISKYQGEGGEEWLGWRGRRTARSCWGQRSIWRSIQTDPSLRLRVTRAPCHT